MVTAMAMMQEQVLVTILVNIYYILMVGEGPTHRPVNFMTKPQIDDLTASILRKIWLNIT